MSKQPDHQIRFEVIDTGIGIKEEAIPRLFSAFEQLDLARNKGVVGTGLGLAITKRFCDMMQGSIEVESTYGKGSKFIITLPLEEGDESNLPSEERKDSISFKVPGTRALLVDDIEINLQIAAYMLELYDIKSDFALTGKQAIEKVMENQYDIILMDHMMPEMDGMEATKIIRALDGYMATVPIIALTANAASGAVEAFLKNGFDGFLAKPIDDHELAECLLRWMPKEKIQFESSEI